MNVRLLTLIGALAGICFGSAVSAQTIPANGPAPSYVRGGNGSDRNLVVVRRRLEALIDQMQRDRHDYDGHRVKAIDDLQLARAEIDAALRYDNHR